MILYSLLTVWAGDMIPVSHLRAILPRLPGKTGVLIPPVATTSARSIAAVTTTPLVAIIIAAWALLAWASNIHGELPVSQGLPVELGDGLVRLILGAHRNKSKPL